MSICCSFLHISSKATSARQGKKGLTNQERKIVIMYPWNEWWPLRFACVAVVVREATHHHRCLDFWDRDYKWQQFQFAEFWRSSLT